MCTKIASDRVAPGWGCCRCKTYNGERLAVCRHCNVAQCQGAPAPAGSNVVELSSRRTGCPTPLELARFAQQLDPDRAATPEHVEELGGRVRGWLESDPARLRDEERARADIARASPTVRAAAVAFVRIAKLDRLSFGGMNAIVAAAFLDVDEAEALAGECDHCKRPPHT